MAKQMRSYKLPVEIVDGLEAIAAHHGLVSDRSTTVGKPNATAAIERLVRDELRRIGRRQKKNSGEVLTSRQ